MHIRNGRYYFVYKSHIQVDTTWPKTDYDEKKQDYADTTLDNLNKAKCRELTYHS